jgi:TolB protein
MVQSISHYWFFLLTFLVFAPPANAETNRIAYVDPTGDVHTIQPDGNGRRKLASGEMLQTIAFTPLPIQQEEKGFYSWPVWSPDGSRIACFRLVAGENTQVDGLYMFDVASSQVLHSYKAPGLQPIYSYWAPNSQALAILLGGTDPLSLGLWPPPEGQHPKTLAQGMPFYFDWRADAQALLVHTGGEQNTKDGHSVSMLDVGSGKRTFVSRSPAVFGPPSWSQDGKWLAYGDQAEEKDKTAKTALMIAAADGSAAKSLGTFPEKITMEWSPTQPQLAIATSSFADDPMVENLQLIDVPSGKVRSLVKEHLAAYFWSPDGNRILYARRKLDSFMWTWCIVDVTDGKISEVVDFLPARPMLIVFQYFDQYALSHRLWSPDSKHFVFTGSAGLDAHPAAAIRNPSVYVTDATEHATPKSVADGHIAFWSPR